MHAIGEIEDIDGGHEAKLVGLGVRTTDDFLARAATPAGRSGLAAAVGVSDAVVLKWANCADLMRVDGIGMQFADLLEEAGVDTIPELAQRNAHNLHERVVQVNTERSLAGRAPTEHEVESWIAQAKALPRILEYSGAATAATTISAVPPVAEPTIPAAPLAPAAASTSDAAPPGGGYAPEPAVEPAAADESDGHEADAAPAPLASSSYTAAPAAATQGTSWFARMLSRLRGGG
jgi:predicted flap endonuclease-1-like 5' DNA nuclease